MHQSYCKQKRCNRWQLIMGMASVVLMLSVGFGGTARAAITSITPSDGSTLTGSSQTFSWTGTGVLEYWLYVGTTKGAKDIYNSGSLGTATSTTVNGLPTDGSTVYLRLWHREEGGWKWTYYTYTALTTGSGGGGGNHGGTRVSAVDFTAQTQNQTNQPHANPETFISLPVTTTTAGTFVMGFSSQTSPFLCPIGPSGPCDTIQVIQRIFLDGKQTGLDVRSSRVFEPGGSLDQYMTWTTLASNIEPGEHTVEVRVSCIIPGSVKTCVGEGFKAGSSISTLWAMHPN